MIAEYYIILKLIYRLISNPKIGLYPDYMPVEAHILKNLGWNFELTP